MRLLVTGGTGFIGSHLAEEGRRRGAEVVVLGSDRPAGGAGQRRAAARGRASRSSPGSITDAELCRRAVRGAHPRVPPCGRDAGGRQERRVLRVGQPRRHAAAAGGGRRGSGSSGSSTAARSGSTGTARPASPPRTRRSRRATSTSGPRSSAERLVREFAADARLPYVILRPADVYGPRDQRLLKLFKGVSRGRFPLFGSGDGPAPHGVRGRRGVGLLPGLRARRGGG